MNNIKYILCLLFVAQILVTGFSQNKDYNIQSKDLSKQALTSRDLYMASAGEPQFNNSMLVTANIKSPDLKSSQNQVESVSRESSNIPRRKMTKFDPKKHGFNFGNNGFKPYLGDGGSISIDFSGFCGGMTYTAGDYYYKNIGRPDQDYTPAPGTNLYNYIYSRQSTSIENISGQIVEYNFNPEGARNKQFWGWAVNEKLRQLVNNIDAGKPTPILMLRVDKGPADNHWVMAIGYDLGGYKWGKENDPNVNNIKIFISDPNHPRKYMALMPRKEKWDLKYGTYDMTNDKFLIEEANWNCRSFHPNTNFAQSVTTPPKIKNLRTGGSDLVYQLVAQLRTGGDDLRGGNDQVSFRVKYSDGKEQLFKNANLSQRWPSGSIVNVVLPLRTPQKLSAIKSIELSTNFGGGISGDNWNLDYISTNAYSLNGKKTHNIIEPQSGEPWKRFTGDDKRTELRSKYYKPTNNSNSNTGTSKQLISIDISEIKNVIHNNDCTRIQGKIIVKLFNTVTGKEYSPIQGANTLIDWKGNKTKNFKHRKFESIPTKEVRFNIDKTAFQKGQYRIEIHPNQLKSCHKSCDFCSGYHCNVRYQKASIAGNKLQRKNNRLSNAKLLMLATNKGKKDNHTLTVNLVVTSG